MEETSIPAGGLTFDALTDGPPDGPAVLLLHGFPQTSYSWRHQIPALAEAGYRVIAPDQRGYSPGARPAAVADYAIEKLVGDVLAIADASGLDRFHLVGHDWGGAVAWATAALHPERLITLTSLSTPHPAAFARAHAEGDQKEKSSYMEFFRSEAAEPTFLADGGALLRGLYQSSGMPEADVEEYMRFFSPGPALTGGLNWYRATELGQLGGVDLSVSVPTLYVWSTNDVALGQQAAEWTAEFVSGPYRFEVLEGMSHWISEEAPEPTTKLILEHLASVPS